MSASIDAYCIPVSIMIKSGILLPYIATKTLSDIQATSPSLFTLADKNVWRTNTIGLGQVCRSNSCNYKQNYKHISLN